MKGRGDDDSVSTSDQIGAFHVVLKRLAQARSQGNKVLCDELNTQLNNMGGLKAYQALSLFGESVSGFNSSLFVLQQLRQLYPQQQQRPLRLLDVGSIQCHYNDPLVDAVSIDLYSDDPNVLNVDFFDFAPQQPVASFDVVVLSLVLNFVPLATQRGLMLHLTSTLLRPQSGLCFVILPVACINNSRYFRYALWERLCRRVGLHCIHHQTTDRLFMCVLRKQEQVVGKNGFEMEAMFRRKLCRGGRNRNNFLVLLPEQLRSKKEKEEEEEEEEERVDVEDVDGGEKKKKSTSNQRKRARMKRMKEAKKQQQEEKGKKKTKSEN